MNIVDMKGNLHDARVLAIIALSMYMPTKEKLNSCVSQYESDANVFAFACEENASICGAIILRHIAGGAYEIIGIATDPACRNQGIASKLIDFAVETLPCMAIKAETDDDAVGFYRKHGFHIDSSCEKYPGCVRYLCTLNIV